MRLSGLSPDASLVEMIELPDHPYFVACQFHPELKSRPTRPHPLFASFVAAAVAAKRKRAEHATNGQQSGSTVAAPLAQAK
jgi:CTP synthase